MHISPGLDEHTSPQLFALHISWRVRIRQPFFSILSFTLNSVPFTFFSVEFFVLMLLFFFVRDGARGYYHLGSFWFYAEHSPSDCDFPGFLQSFSSLFLPCLISLFSVS